jgi:hypothetical protein
MVQADRACSMPIAAGPAVARFAYEPQQAEREEEMAMAGSHPSGEGAPGRHRRERKESGAE